MANTALTSVSPDGTRKMGVDWTSKSVVSKSLAGDASRAKVFGREHAACSHDAHECVESRFVGVLDKVYIKVPRRKKVKDNL
jgi:hypothetical protein